MSSDVDEPEDRGSYVLGVQTWLCFRATIAPPVSQGPVACLGQSGWTPHPARTLQAASGELCLAPCATFCIARSRDTVLSWNSTSDVLALAISIVVRMSTTWEAFLMSKASM